jgi:hypothetical protein
LSSTFVSLPLVATALPPRDRAVTPFDRGRHHAAALSWADRDAPWANADSGTIAPTIPIVAVGTVPPEIEWQLPAGIKMVGVNHWRDELIRKGVVDRTAANPRAEFKRLRQALAARKLIGDRDDFIWPV